MSEQDPESIMQPEWFNVVSQICWEGTTANMIVYKEEEWEKETHKQL